MNIRDIETYWDANNALDPRSGMADEAEFIGKLVDLNIDWLLRDEVVSPLDSTLDAIASKAIMTANPISAADETTVEAWIIAHPVLAPPPPPPPAPAAPASRPARPRRKATPPAPAPPGPVPAALATPQPNAPTALGSWIAIALAIAGFILLGLGWYYQDQTKSESGKAVGRIQQQLEQQQDELEGLKLETQIQSLKMEELRQKEKKLIIAPNPTAIRDDYARDMSEQ
ncbi:MAG: hypothetical protein WCX71_04495 [Candidatus Buchananbacteria bacterium]